MSKRAEMETCEFHLGVLPVSLQLRPIGQVVTEFKVEIMGTQVTVLWGDQMPSGEEILSCSFTVGGWNSPVPLGDEQRTRRRLSEVADRLPHFRGVSRDRVVAALRAVSANQA